jgi:hypothetical protein
MEPGACRGLSIAGGLMQSMVEVGGNLESLRRVRVQGRREPTSTSPARIEPRHANAMAMRLRAALLLDLPSARPPVR